MRPSISRRIRKSVADRAQGVCEYCLLSEEDSFFPHEVDHIISLKHGGEHLSSNFAWACLPCNRSKGSDIGSMVPPSNDFVRFYHPRKDDWAAHFRLEGPHIVALSSMAQATIHILQLNHPDRLLERKALIEIDRYPGREISSAKGKRG